MKFNSLKLFLFFVFLRATHLSASITTPYSGEVDAVIFDCDGVLVDTEYLKFLAWQEALTSKNINFTLEEYMPLVGHSTENILLLLKKLKNQDLPRDIIDLRNNRYRQLQKQGVAPIPEVVAFAKHFAAEKQTLGIQLALASSAPTDEILQNLDQLGMKEAFDLVISGHDDLDSYTDSEGKNKPKPYIYLEAAKRLGVSPSKCLVFEDTAAGIEAATSAGMIAIAVPNRFTQHQDFSKATKVIQENQLKEIYENLSTHPSH